MTGNAIDFIITWVDGRDPDWQRRKAAYTGEELTDSREERFRDWDLLPFWFRAVENYAPWVRKVWFVCDQEPPAWLNTEHPKLNIVRHEDYLPEEYRPAFNASAIELNFHRIEGLSEQFVFFNDDFFLLSPIEPDYFFKNGLPRDCAILNPVSTDTLAIRPGERVNTMTLINAEYLNREYRFYSCLKKHPFKWFHPSYGKGLIKNLVCSMWPKFVGFDETHLPQAFLKSSFRDAWETNFDILDQTSRHHIRHMLDVNQWFIRERQLAEGKFSVRKCPKDAVFRIQDERPLMHETIRTQRVPMICINDAGDLEPDTFERLKAELISDFNCILPVKSSFER